MKNSIQLANLVCPDVFDYSFGETKTNIEPFFACYYSYSSSRITAFVLKQDTKTVGANFKVSQFPIAEGMPFYTPMELKFYSDTKFMVKYKIIVSNSDQKPIYFSIYNMPQKLGGSAPTPIPTPIGENNPFQYASYIVAPSTGSKLQGSSSFYKQFPDMIAEMTADGTKLVISRFDSQAVDYVELDSLKVEVFSEFKFKPSQYELNYRGIDNSSQEMKKHVYNLGKVFISQTKPRENASKTSRVIWTIVICLLCLAVLVILYILYSFYERQKD